MTGKIRILVVGCGHMGSAHARAYQRLKDFEIAGLVSRGDGSREKLAAEIGDCPQFSDFETALRETTPDAVSINTYPDTHAAFAIAAMRKGCHVFVEKPLAETVSAAESVLQTARETDRKLVVGYILHHHPTYMKLVEIGRTLGKPLVMRMNSNQQSFGAYWTTHKNLSAFVSPLVDCGVHYVDIMCRLTQARPLHVHALATRLSEEIAADSYNYGHLHIRFDDGSMGWFEAGWGPMISSTAHHIKDVIGPRGSISIANRITGNIPPIDTSDTIRHTRLTNLVIHSAQQTPDGAQSESDIRMEMEDGFTHASLCEAEQAYFLRVMRENLDLREHHRAAIDSLRIVLAADESCRTGKVVDLDRTT